MNIRFLGVHHSESKNTRLVSFVVDQILAVDAGSLTSELGFDEQKKIKAILVTHGHYDHIKSIPSFIFSNKERTVKVYGSQETLDIISSHFFDGIIYPNFTKKTSFLENPPIKLMALNPYSPLDIEGYQVTAVPISHIMGSVGYAITSADQKTIFYTGDTAPGLVDIWKNITPDLLIIDVTFPDKLFKTAQDSRHLCPQMLRDELIQMEKLKGHLPDVAVIHLSSKYEKEISQELQKVARDLNASIVVTSEGKQLHI